MVTGPALHCSWCVKSRVLSSSRATCLSVHHSRQPLTPSDTLDLVTISTLSVKPFLARHRRKANMSGLTPLTFRTLSSSLPVYMAVGKTSSSFAVRQLHSLPSQFRPHTPGFDTLPFRHPAQRYPRLRQLSTQTASSPTIADEVPVVLPTGSNAKGKAKAVDGAHGEVIGHDTAASSPSASTKVAPPRRRTLGLKSKKAAISLVCTLEYLCR